MLTLRRSKGLILIRRYTTILLLIFTYGCKEKEYNEGIFSYNVFVRHSSVKKNQIWIIDIHKNVGLIKIYNTNCISRELVEEKEIRVKKVSLSKKEDLSSKSSNSSLHSKDFYKRMVKFNTLENENLDCTLIEYDGQESSVVSCKRDGKLKYFTMKVSEECKQYLKDNIR